MGLLEIALAGAAVALACNLALSIMFAVHLYRGHPARHDTEEISLPPTMRVGPRLEEFGPGRPVPPGAPRGESWDSGEKGW